MQQDSSKAVIFELLDELLHSWWTVVAGVCFGLAGAVLALHYSPKIYSATTLTRIAPPQISSRLLESTVTEDMARRLLAVEDAILSRPYMVQLIDETIGLPEDEETLESMIARVRSRVDVATDRRAGMFTLSYQNSSPDLASGVVNTLTRLYVDANDEFREAQAEDTVATFEMLLADARAEFETFEKQLNEYRAQHPFETQEYLDFNQREKESQLRDLDRNHNEQVLARERLQDLRDRLDHTDWSQPGLAVPGGVVFDPLTLRIRETESELENLRMTYTESHPEVVKTKQRLDELLEQAANRTAVPEEGGDPELAVPVDPARAAVEAQVDEVARELASLETEESRLRRKIDEIDRKIRRTPEVQRRLTELQNAYNIAEAEVRDLQGKAKEARDSHYLESSDKGERLEVLEWAATPIRPVSPQPPRVYSLGLAVGLVLFVGPLGLRRVLNPLVASEAGLRALVAVPVLVSIPRVVTRDTAGLSRRRLFKNLSFSVLCAAVLAAAIVGFG